MIKSVLEIEYSGGLKKTDWRCKISTEEYWKKTLREGRIMWTEVGENNKKEGGQPFGTF